LFIREIDLPFSVNVCYSCEFCAVCLLFYQLVGYNKPATLQVFIGTDVGRVAPHMFYQACRVSGKNSTPCMERKIDGTIVIEVDFDPAKDMVIT